MNYQQITSTYLLIPHITQGTGNHAIQSLCVIPYAYTIPSSNTFFWNSPLVYRIVSQEKCRSESKTTFKLRASDFAHDQQTNDTIPFHPVISILQNLLAIRTQFFQKRLFDQTNGGSVFEHQWDPDAHNHLGKMGARLAE